MILGTTTRLAQLSETPIPHVPTFQAVTEGKFYNWDGSVGTYLVFRCPKCKAKNYHGAWFKQPGKADGHRHSHCRCWPNGYFLRETQPKRK